MTFSGRAAQFTYQFDTLKDPSGGAIELPPIPNDAQATRERPRYMEITVTLSYQGEPTQPLPGDANVDGKVNVADASTVLRYLVGLAQLSGQCLLNADVDGIEGVSAQDALEIVRYCIGLTAALPAA